MTQGQCSGGGSIGWGPPVLELAVDQTTKEPTAPAINTHVAQPVVAHLCYLRVGVCVQQRGRTTRIVVRVQWGFSWYHLDCK